MIKALKSGQEPDNYHQIRCIGVEPHTTIRYFNVPVPHMGHENANCFVKQQEQEIKITDIEAVHPNSLKEEVQIKITEIQEVSYIHVLYETGWISVFFVWTSFCSPDQDDQNPSGPGTAWVVVMLIWTCSFFPKKKTPPLPPGA